MPTRAALTLGAALLLAVLVRGPLHHATFAQPLSNDDALVLLMARAVASGEVVATFWNQPYGGALDAWLLAPLSTLPPHGLFRAYQLAAALLLLALVATLARRAGGDAAGGAALLLLAAGPPYLALLGALGLAPYLLAPLLLGPLALLSLRYADGRPPAPLAACAGAGLLAGLDTWNTLLAGPAAAGLIAGALLVRRDRAWARAAGAAAAGAAAGLLPLVLAARPETVGSVAGLRPAWLWPAAGADLLRAAAGLFGLAPPLVIDGPMRVVLPLPLAVLLGAGLGLAVAAGARRRVSWPLLFWALACAAAFVAGARGRGDRVRYLLLAAPPLLAVAGVGLAALRERSRLAAALVGSAIVVPWVVGTSAVAAAWRDPRQAPRFWGAVDLQPAAGTLAGLDVRAAYATNQLAARLAVTGDRELRATPAWNERFPGHPLQWRDEVDLDPRAAWVLHDEISRGLPRAPAFRSLLREMGGTWRETRAGEMTVFHSFAPPWDERRPLRLERAHREGDALDLALLEPQPVAALVVLLRGADLDERCELRVDGTPRALANRRHGFQWWNGAPRAGWQMARALVLDGVPAQNLRLACPPPVEIEDVFVYGVAAPALPAAGASLAEAALAHARAGRWREAASGFEEAVAREPHRASWRVAARRARERAERLRPASLPDGLAPASAAAQ